MAKPSAPANLNVSAVDRVVWLAWSEVSGALSYDVDRKGPEDSDYSITGSSTQASYVDKDADADSRYDYRVRAVNGDGGGDWSESRSVTVSSATPQITSNQFTAAILIGGAVLILLWIMNGAFHFVSFPDITATTTRESAIVQVGSYLVRLGIIILVITFVPAFAIWAVTSVRIKKTPDANGPKATGGAIPSLSDVSTFLKAVPDILKVPSGYGALLLVLGVFLLVGGGLGSQDSTAGSASSSPAASGAAQTPVPDKSCAPVGGVQPSTCP